jgi:type II secretory pathway pseudopilin PulG
VARHGDPGETLVEIILAVVIIGISVSALVSGLATAANAGMVQRDGAVADTALRNLAEDAKAEARTCTVGERLALDLAVPDHWTAAVRPSAPACPAATSPLRLTFTVTGPTDETASLDVVVRTP